MANRVTMGVLRGLAWALAAAIVVMTWGPVGLRPQLGHPQFERLGAYVVLAIVWTLAYPRHRAYVAVGLAIGAVGLEFGQLFIPGRDARVADGAAKVAGVIAGVLATLTLQAGWRAVAKS